MAKMKVEKSDVIDGLKPLDRSLVFRNYVERGSDIENHLEFLQSPPGMECGNRVEITAFPQYTTVASDTSDVEDVLALLDRIVDMARFPPGTPAPGTIVMGVRAGYETLENIFREGNVSGEKVTLVFPLRICEEEGAAGPPRAVVAAKLRVAARGKVSDAEEEDYEPTDDGASFAKLTLSLNIGNDPLTRDRFVSRVDAETGSRRYYAIVNYSLVDGTTTVVANVAPHCRVPSEVTWDDQVAGLTVDEMQLFIEIVPAEYYSYLPETMRTYLREHGMEVEEPSGD